jgi:hypothetical protein
MMALLTSLRKKLKNDIKKHGLFVLCTYEYYILQVIYKSMYFMDA